MWVIAHVSIEAYLPDKSFFKKDGELKFEETEKVFDPEEVYGDAPNPTKL